VNNSGINFDFEGCDVRVIQDEQGEPWFVLKDVLKAMGSSTRPAIAKNTLDQQLGDGVYNEYPILDLLGRTQEVTIISESATTFLVARSNTESGKRLNKWIHTEVLPQIRKTGSYQTQPALPDFRNPMEAIDAYIGVQRKLIEVASDLKNEMALRIEEQSRREHLETEIEEVYQPKADVHDNWMESSRYYDLQIAARILDCGLGRNKLFELLRRKSILMEKRGPRYNLPYQRYIDSGYFVTKTYPRQLFSGEWTDDTKVFITKKGLKWLMGNVFNWVNEVNMYPKKRSDIEKLNNYRRITKDQIEFNVARIEN
jgi:prophage antirepressor-like protein